MTHSLRTTIHGSLARRRGTTVANGALAAVGALAVASFVLEYGAFDFMAARQSSLHLAQAVLALVFVAERVSRLLLADGRWRFVREHRVDFLVLALAAAGLACGCFLPTPAGSLQIVVKGYLLLALVLRAADVTMALVQSRIHFTWLLIGSFVILSLVGSGLLMLPAAKAPSARPVQYIEALFTSVSALCVTGLTVRGTGSDFSLLGQGVILALVQLGGLGIMLYGTVLAMMVGQGLTARGLQTLGDMLSTEHVGQVRRMALFIVLATGGIEAVGAAMLYPMFLAVPPGLNDPLRAVWFSVFHSVSAFCNAGFSLYDASLMAGLGAGWSRPLRDHWQVLGVMGPLIVVGGLGFPVLQNLWSRLRGQLGRLGSRLASRPARPGIRRARLTLHSKLVLVTSAALLVLGAAGLALLEPFDRSAQASGSAGPWAGLDGWGRLREASLMSASARTAGFNTIDPGRLSDAGKMWLIGLMVVGGSPGSTAGGLKTVTLAVILLTVLGVLRRRDDPEAFGRSLSNEIVRKALALAVLYVTLVSVVTLLLVLTFGTGERFINLLFEGASACGTVGLSTGLTPQLPPLSKLVLIVGMFAGRLGPITLMQALTARVRRQEYSYPAENVVIW